MFHKFESYPTVETVSLFELLFHSFNFSPVSHHSPVVGDIFIHTRTYEMSFSFAEIDLISVALSSSSENVF